MLNTNSVPKPNLVYILCTTRASTKSEFVVHIKLRFVKAVILGTAVTFLRLDGSLKLNQPCEYLGKAKFTVSSNPVVENNQAVEELKLECVAWADVFVFEVSLN